MDIRQKTTHIDFVSKSRFFGVISIILVLISLGLILIKGFNYGIDFAGGTELQLKFSKKTDATQIREALKTINMQDARVQAFGETEQNEFLLHVPQANNDLENYQEALRAAIVQAYPNNALQKMRVVGDRLYLTFEQSIDVQKLSAALLPVGGGNLTLHDVAPFGKEGANEYAVNYSGVAKRIVTELEKKMGTGSFELRREDTVGAKVGRELRTKSIMAIFVSLILLLIYIWFRFDIDFAPGAILALFHDAVITLGLFVIFNMEVNLSVLAAILTLVGYSLNDTIVIYDRVRENMKLMSGAALSDIINASINQTLSRTIMTSGATMLVTVALMMFGGDILYNFAFCLTFGIITGTYSTIYIASPIAIFIQRLGQKKAA